MSKTITRPIEILNSAFALFEKNYRQLLPFILGIITLLILLGGITTGIDPANPSWLGLTFGGIASIVSLLLNAFFLILVIQTYDTESKRSFSEILHKARQLFWPAIGVMILNGIVIFGGYLLFIIPGILFGVWFSLSIYSVLIDDQRGLKALMHSKHIINGRFWPVVWRVVFIALAMVLAISPFIIVNIFFPFEFIAILQQFWLFVFVIPLVFAYNLVLYKDLRDTAGEFVYQPRQGRKFLLIGLAGIILVPIVLFATAVYFLRGLLI